jgi:hypothetical protein
MIFLLFVLSECTDQLTVTVTDQEVLKELNMTSYKVILSSGQKNKDKALQIVL